MKGKKFLIVTLMFILMAVISLGGVMGFGADLNSIKFAKAEAIDGFSEQYEGNIIFSVEKVYFANEENRNKNLTYNGYEFNSIQNSQNETWYFGDNALISSNDYSSKYIVRNGQYVIVDDMQSKVASYQNEASAQESVNIKEGIMITLGGYYYSQNGEIVTTTENSGANLEIVSIQVMLNGSSLLDIPGVRTYNSKYYDFVWFIDALEENEGYYQIEIAYMVEGGTLLRQTFDFYMLLRSGYEQQQEINGQSYSTVPIIENATKNENNYTFNSGTTLQYPTLTFDYTRYNLSYTFNSGDTQRSVEFEYDEQNSRLLLHTTVYNSTTTKEYNISPEFNNTIITLMFVDAGEYNFNFQYVYYYQGVRLTIPEENLQVEDIKLNIYGYQLKYSKSGSLGADLTYLEIYQNGTMFILVNGFTDSTDIELGQSLGVNYTLTSGQYKTGTIETANSKSAGFNLNDGENLENLEIIYQNTNQGGLWLTLNDEYDLTNSYYYYNQKLDGLIADGNKHNLTKVSTFTSSGYYLIVASYSYTDNSGGTQVRTQYFAFRITSSTPKMNLFKTDETNVLYVTDENKENFYSHEYTNKNVYATWEEPGVFESKIQGILYYGLTNNKYPTEATLKAVANGGINSSIGRAEYIKESILTQSGSYMLVLQLEGTATKIYSYFTIDKEGITGLEIYEVASYMLGNNVVYSIAQDANFNYITHTNLNLINTNFTISWDDKPSRANVSACYRFIPFVAGSDNSGTKITQVVNGITYSYIVNNYMAGGTSEQIFIEKPALLSSTLNVDNVLSNQGIYIFTLIDDAGNRLQYIVVVDNTEAVFNAWYQTSSGELQDYTSGEVVTSDVSIEWGTHKAIDISNVSDDDIKNIILNSELPEDYYNNENSNFMGVSSLFTQYNSNYYLIVENDRAEIQLQRDNNENVYVITKSGEQQIRYPNGNVSVGWTDEISSTLFTDASRGGMTIKRDEEARRYYQITVVGSNQLNSSSTSSFIVAITPDEAQGDIYSAGREGELYDNWVASTSSITKYFEGQEEIDENIYITNYNNAQASDDGLFVFEWLHTDENTFQVTEVRYNYYQLMSQDVLNSLTADEIKNYPYYPYSYVNTSYILRTENDIETISEYTAYQRDGKNVMQSNPINIGFETYYDSEGNLVSNKVTQTGLYIITRRLNNDPEQEFSYAFFVDRNGIVGYSISSVNEKIVGQFIHASVPNSEGQIYFDNFAMQGLESYSREYRNGDESTPITYSIYLSTNKLPTQIKVPNGKYVSGNIDTKELLASSYYNLKLKLSVYFLDNYNLLTGDGIKGGFIRLMNNVTNEGGYISFEFDEGYETSIYRQATMRTTGDGLLSLPGTYVFVINDEVGHELDGVQVVDYNQFIFGVRLTKQAPTTDVYTYAEINNIQSNKLYSEDKILYTNQEFVDFEILVEDKNSFNAQVDINNFEIIRINNGREEVWLRVVNGQVDTSGIIKDRTRIIPVNSEGEETSIEEDIVKYIIKLDTGLTLSDDRSEIISFEEYVYNIKIQYILDNSGSEYYTYLVDGQIESFYTSTYNVYIDRSPNTDNLDKILQDQEQYFQQFENYLAEENNVEQGEINSSFGYRSTTTVQDYYGLTNRLYYSFVDLGDYSNATKSMYAIAVNELSSFDSTNLERLYYRPLSLNSSLSADTRMGLLPICDTYFGNSSGFYTFSENLIEYRNLSFQNYTNKTAINYSEVFGDSEYIEGAFYEIVEKDLAGNLTQYVIYFAPEDMMISLNISGYPVNDGEISSDIETVNLTFGDSEGINQKSFLGIEEVSIQNLQNDFINFYGKIEINKADNNYVLYIDSTTTQAEIGEYIKNIIVEHGNYLLTYRDVYNNTYTLRIDNYPNSDVSLDLSALKIQHDVYGNKYIDLNGLNTEIAPGLYLYLTKITFTYDINNETRTVSYDASFNNGYISLSLAQGSNSYDEVRLDSSVRDRIYLADNIQYTVELTDALQSVLIERLSTSGSYKPYSLQTLSNSYTNNNIVYTAGDVVIRYDSGYYQLDDNYVTIYLNNSETPLDISQANDFYTIETNGDYTLLTLKHDLSEDFVGSLRRFVVNLYLRSDELKLNPIRTYEVWIDTRTTDFNITNQNLISRLNYVYSELNIDSASGDYIIDDLRNPDLYKNLLSETVEISWTRLNNNYFNYRYELIEFVDSSSYNQLLTSSSATNYTIIPKENTTGKYVLKVTITGKDNTWIASRIFTINMSTSVSGLYKVENNDGEEKEYSSITNLREIEEVFATHSGGGITYPTAMATALGFANVNEMQNAFTSFGYNTAIPMYISTEQLTLHSNQDNGVYSKSYSIVGGSGNTTISLYYIYRANYRTFAIIVRVADSGGDILNYNDFTFHTSATQQDLLLESSTGNSKTIYNTNAEYYKLTFNSVNKNTNSNILERHNKILIYVSYNNSDYGTPIVGEAGEITTIEFKNGGTYRLRVEDMAGNVQMFGNGSSQTDYFTLVVMKGVLYTINGTAPIEYAYYDQPVVLTINNTNSFTGEYNYDFESIVLTARLNSNNYTGYIRNSYTYTFSEYGTYLINITARLRENGETVSSQIVFTILNPNEARSAIDFTPIAGYDIISVMDISQTVPRDITSEFLALLADKSNQDNVEYNRLITYERLTQALQATTQGKMKFTVVYEVNDDRLFPARQVQFSFTMNNEIPSLTSSIEAGGSTTKTVTIQFNPAIIYGQVGDCSLVINGVSVLDINENSANQITQMQLSTPDQYYVQIVSDSGNVITSLNFTIKEPLNAMSIILIVVIVAIILALIGTFIWLRTRMKVR